MTERKEYEMSDSYKQALKHLLDRIKTREWLAEKIKIASPAQRPNLLKQLAELDRHIEKFEQALANEYELAQRKGQLEEEYKAQMEDLEELTDAILADMKEKAPELYEKIVAELGEDE
jgi:dsDNA-specific endonuclease/ATPase MutS2